MGGQAQKMRVFLRRSAVKAVCALAPRACEWGNGRKARKGAACVCAYECGAPRTESESESWAKGGRKM